MPLQPDFAAPAVVPRPQLLACEVCDALYRRVRLAPSEQARCRRCGSLLGRGHRLDLQAMAALNVAALVVFVIANLQPIVVLNLRGVPNTASLPAALWQTWAAGEHGVALLAAAVAFVFPAAVILLRLYALSPLLLGRLPRGWHAALRALRFALRWSMVEVLLLSALVATVRIAAMATVQPGPGLFAFGVLVVLLAALESAGVHRLWRLAETRPA
ncbi:MAG: paraquat-inducible protein A [Pseudomonadota bacterium]